MATFRNPNEPQQPQAGVYGWFVSLPAGVRCLYIGQAGSRSSAKEKGTLLRGVTELFRESFSSDSPRYQVLDTEFVVGTAIRFFERRHGPVFWMHLDNEPGSEKRWHQNLAPLLQHSRAVELLPQLKIRVDELQYWKWPSDLAKCRSKLAEAEQRVFEELARLTIDSWSTSFDSSNTWLPVANDR